MSGADERLSVLVGMLHVGEPSVPSVRALITGQDGVDVELLEIAHLPEREAHARLYRAFDDASASRTHDALVKVDADMELVEPGLLHALATMFRRHPDLDHIMLGVDDWFSGTRIQGMNAWRCGVRWTSPPPELFTDLPENTVSTKLKLMDAGRPLVLHAADPTDEQAVRYGLHRGLKAVESGKRSRVERLLEVIDHAERHPERGRRLAVTAIIGALRDQSAATALLSAGEGETHASERAQAAGSDQEVFAAARYEVQRLLQRIDAGTGAAHADTPLERRRALRLRSLSQSARARRQSQPDLGAEFLTLLSRSSRG